MFDNTQTLLVAVVIALTLLLSLIGVQVFFVLREVKKTIEKFNKIIDDAGVVSGSVSKSISSLSNSITSISGITGLLGWLSKKRKKAVEPKEKTEDNE